jgi:hypothetical protein
MSHSASSLGAWSYDVLNAFIIANKKQRQLVIGLCKQMAFRNFQNIKFFSSKITVLRGSEREIDNHSVLLLRQLITC